MNHLPLCSSVFCIIYPLICAFLNLACKSKQMRDGFKAPELFSIQLQSIFCILAVLDLSSQFWFTRRLVINWKVSSQTLKIDVIHHPTATRQSWRMLKDTVKHLGATDPDNYRSGGGRDTWQTKTQGNILLLHSPGGQKLYKYIRFQLTTVGCVEFFIKSYIFKKDRGV